jgi:hypothetical protein
MNWHRFCLGLNSPDRPDLAPPYLPHPTISSLGTHTRQIALGIEKRLYTGFLARFARLVDQDAFEQGQKQTSTCSTCPGTPEHAQALGPACPRQATPDPAPSPVPAPIKQPQAATVLPRTPSAPPEHEFAGVLSAHGVPSAAQGHPPWTRHSNPPPSNPSPRLASLEPRKASRALRPNTTSPEAPDCHRRTPANRRRARVDRIAWWAIFKFLAPTAPLTSREAPRALWLSSTAVSRPEHAPPTSPTACARGQPSFGHQRRRSAPRCDRQRPPDLTQPFAGPLPSPVSRATTFSLLGYCSGEEGVWVREGKRLGGYVLSQWLMRIVPRGTFKRFG